MVKKSTLLAFVLLIATLFNACKYDTETDLFPSVEQCETEDMSFERDILSIFETHCNNSLCHGGTFPQGRIPLWNFEGVREVVIDGRLIGALRHESGFNPMPEGGDMLSDCLIRKIEAWILQGFPDN